MMLRPSTVEKGAGILCSRESLYVDCEANSKNPRKWRAGFSLYVSYYLGRLLVRREKKAERRAKRK